MRVVITCGPAIAPIDEVRRITNFSTGELGVLLANAFAASGREVICLKGEAATTQLTAHEGVDVIRFSTNDDLAEKIAATGDAAAVFHAAALCDYEVASVRDEYGEILSAAKIPSRAGELNLVLKPARKLLPELSAMFPGARIVGWKYELNGTLADALHAGAHQLEDCGTGFCVVNGAAYGEGFGLLDREGRVRHFGDKAELCAALVALAI
ncbi:MAG: phosphopantothenoylcysteine decarboxylase [Chthoniobacterales bacterium]